MRPTCCGRSPAGPGKRRVLGWRGSERGLFLGSLLEAETSWTRRLVSTGVWRGWEFTEGEGEEGGAGETVSKRLRGWEEGLGVVHVFCGCWSLLTVLEKDLRAGEVAVKPRKTSDFCGGANGKAGHGFGCWTGGKGAKLWPVELEVLDAALSSLTVRTGSVWVCPQVEGRSILAGGSTVGARGAGGSGIRPIWPSHSSRSARSTSQSSKSSWATQGFGSPLAWLCCVARFGSELFNVGEGVGRGEREWEEDESRLNPKATVCPVAVVCVLLSDAVPLHGAADLSPVCWRQIFSGSLWVTEEARRAQDDTAAATLAGPDTEQEAQSVSSRSWETHTHGHTHSGITREQKEDHYVTESSLKRQLNKIRCYYIYLIFKVLANAEKAT